MICDNIESWRRYFKVAISQENLKKTKDFILIHKKAPYKPMIYTFLSYELLNSMFFKIIESIEKG